MEAKDGLENKPKPLPEIVPNNFEQTMQLIGDYALDSWMIQIMKGVAAHSNLGRNHAMLIAKVIEYSEKEIINLRSGLARISQWENESNDPKIQSIRKFSEKTLKFTV